MTPMLQLLTSGDPEVAVSGLFALAADLLQDL